MAKSPKKGLIAVVCAAIGITAIIVTANVNFNVQMRKAREYISNAEYSKAAEILDEHKSKNGTQEDVYLLYADYYIAQDEYQNAINILKEGAGKAQYTDKINAKIDEINDLYESELNQEPEKPPVESSDSTETSTTESTTTSEVESVPIESTSSVEMSTPESTSKIESESSVTSISESSGGNHFNDYNTPEQQNTTKIVLNTSTKKYHYAHCSEVAKIKPKNYATIGSESEAIAQGYTACKRCH